MIKSILEILIAVTCMIGVISSIAYISDRGIARKLCRSHLTPQERVDMQLSVETCRDTYGVEAKQ